MTTHRTRALQNTRNGYLLTAETAAWLLAINLLALSPTMPAIRRASLEARIERFDSASAAAPLIN
jgi:hypothetical protein